MLTAQLGCLQERWESPGAEYLQSADANGALPGIKEPAKAAAEAIAVSAEPSAALSEDTDLGSEHRVRAAELTVCSIAWAGSSPSHGACYSSVRVRP